MKTVTKLILGLLALGASAWVLTAQDAGRPTGEHRPPPPPDGPPGPGHRPPPPIIAVLDANHDGVIDAKEIANASKALLKLDEDGDGELTRDELCPPPPDDFDGPPPFDGDFPPPPPPRGD